MVAALNQIGIYLHNWFKAAFHLGYLVFIFLMLGLILFTNYHVASIQQLLQTKLTQNSFIASYLLYCIPFAMAYALQPLFFTIDHKKHWKQLAILILVAPAIFAFRVNAATATNWLTHFFEGDVFIAHRFIYKWILKACIVISLVLIWAYYSKNLRLFRLDRFNKLKPYWYMLLLMLPLVLWASLQPSFHQLYPRVHVLYPLNLPIKFLYYITFELSYIFDFISIEFFFRGFLIFAVMRTCGLHCVIPAACFYCCIHLDKPLAEAISSFFGGTILAILSYHTKNVWGGIIVHVGIALFMEVLGMLFI